MKTKNKSKLVPWGKTDRWQHEFFAGYQYKQHEALAAGHDVADCEMFKQYRYHVDTYKARMERGFGSPAFCYGFATAAWIETEMMKGK